MSHAEVSYESLPPPVLPPKLRHRGQRNYSKVTRCLRTRNY